MPGCSASFRSVSSMQDSRALTCVPNAGAQVQSSGRQDCYTAIVGFTAHAAGHLQGMDDTHAGYTSHSHYTYYVYTGCTPQAQVTQVISRACTRHRFWWCQTAGVMCVHRSLLQVAGDSQGTGPVSTRSSGVIRFYRLHAAYRSLLQGTVDIQSDRAQVAGKCSQIRRGAVFVC